LFAANFEAVHPGVARLDISTRTGEGIDRWTSWLRAREPQAVAKDVARPA
jgi:hypothetical protein